MPFSQKEWPLGSREGLVGQDLLKLAIGVFVRLISPQSTDNNETGILAAQQQ